MICKKLIRNILISSAFMAVLFNTSVFADEPDQTETLLDMDIEYLMDVPVVVSAARTEQKLSETSVPITIVTAEDIHYSGLTEIPEILKFYTSIDFLRVERNSYAIGVRGLHEMYSDRLLTLIDGKNAGYFYNNEQQYERLPIFVEDIERIEIIRGPGGAAWGANAFTGVINIITKDIKETKGVFGSTTWDNYGDNWTHLRWGDSKDNLSWRISSGYEFMESSEDAVNNDNFSSSDAKQKMKFDAMFDYLISNKSKIIFGAGYSHQDEWQQSPEYRFDMVRTFAKLDHEFENGNKGYVQFISNYSDRLWSVQTKAWENEIDAQLNFKPHQKHKISIGGDFKATYITSKENYAGAGPAVLNGTPDTEYFAGLFIIDRYQYSEKMWFEGQLRGDWFSQTHTDWSGRAAAFFKIDEKRDGILRFATAKAFRTPLSSLERFSTRQVSLGGGLYLINIEPNDELKNEETWTLEAGYSLNLDKATSFRADAYYQHFDRLIGYNATVGFPIPTRTTTALNIGDAEAYGVELELTRKFNNAQISAWYSYNEFNSEEVDQNIRTFEPAKNKFGIRGRMNLEDGWTVNSNLRFAEYSKRNSTAGTPVIVNGDFNFDFSVAKKIFNDNGELMFGISNLFSRTDEKVASLNGPNTSYPTPGRTLFARLQIHF